MSQQFPSHRPQDTGSASTVGGLGGHELAEGRMEETASRELDASFSVLMGAVRKQRDELSAPGVRTDPSKLRRCHGQMGIILTEAEKVLSSTVTECQKLSAKNQALREERNSLLETQRIHRDTNAKQSLTVRQIRARMYLQSHLRLLHRNMATVLKRRACIALHVWRRNTASNPHDISQRLARIVQEQQAIAAQNRSMRDSANDSDSKDLQHRTGATILFRTVERASRRPESKSSSLRRGYERWSTPVRGMRDASPGRTPRSHSQDRSNSQYSRSPSSSRSSRSRSSSPHHSLRRSGRYGPGTPASRTESFSWFDSPHRSEAANEELRRMPHRLGARAMVRVTTRLEFRCYSRAWRNWSANVRLKAALAAYGRDELFASPVERWTQEAKSRQRKAENKLPNANQVGASSHRSDSARLTPSNLGYDSSRSTSPAAWTLSEHHDESSSAGEQGNNSQTMAMRDESRLRQMRRMGLRIFWRTLKVSTGVRARRALWQWGRLCKDSSTAAHDKPEPEHARAVNTPLVRDPVPAQQISNAHGLLKFVARYAIRKAYNFQLRRGFVSFVQHRLKTMMQLREMYKNSDFLTQRKTYLNRKLHEELRRGGWRIVSRILIARLRSIWRRWASRSFGERQFATFLRHGSQKFRLRSLAQGYRRWVCWVTSSITSESAKLAADAEAEAEAEAAADALDDMPLFSIDGADQDNYDSYDAPASPPPPPQPQRLSEPTPPPVPNLEHTPAPVQQEPAPDLPSSDTPEFLRTATVPGEASKTGVELATRNALAKHEHELLSQAALHDALMAKQKAEFAQLFAALETQSKANISELNARVGALDEVSTLDHGSPILSKQKTDFAERLAALEARGKADMEALSARFSTLGEGVPVMSRDKSDITERLAALEARSKADMDALSARASALGRGSPGGSAQQAALVARGGADMDAPHIRVITLGGEGSSGLGEKAEFTERLTSLESRAKADLGALNARVSALNEGSPGMSREKADFAERLAALEARGKADMDELNVRVSALDDEGSPSTLKEKAEFAERLVALEARGKAEMDALNARVSALDRTSPSPMSRERVQFAERLVALEARGKSEMEALNARVAALDQGPTPISKEQIKFAERLEALEAHGKADMDILRARVSVLDQGLRSVESAKEVPPTPTEQGFHPVEPAKEEQFVPTKEGFHPVEPAKEVTRTLTEQSLHPVEPAKVELSTPTREPAPKEPSATPQLKGRARAIAAAAKRMQDISTVARALVRLFRNCDKQRHEQIRSGWGALFGVWRSNLRSQTISSKKAHHLRATVLIAFAKARQIMAKRWQRWRMAARDKAIVHSSAAIATGLLVGNIRRKFMHIAWRKLALHRAAEIRKASYMSKIHIMAVNMIRKVFERSTHDKCVRCFATWEMVSHKKSLLEKHGKDLESAVASAHAKRELKLRRRALERCTFGLRRSLRSDAIRLWKRRTMYQVNVQRSIRLFLARQKSARLKQGLYVWHQYFKSTRHVEAMQHQACRLSNRCLTRREFRVVRIRLSIWKHVQYEAKKAEERQRRAHRALTRFVRQYLRRNIGDVFVVWRQQVQSLNATDRSLHGGLKILTGYGRRYRLKAMGAGFRRFISRVRIAADEALAAECNEHTRVRIAIRMRHRQATAAFTQWRLVAREIKEAEEHQQTVIQRCVRRFQGREMAIAFESWRHTSQTQAATETTRVEALHSRMQKYLIGTHSMYFAHWLMVINHLIEAEEEENRNRQIRLRFVSRMQWKQLRLGYRTWKSIIGESIEEERRSENATKKAFFEHWRWSLLSKEIAALETRNAMQLQVQIMNRILKGLLLKGWSTWRGTLQMQQSMLVHIRRISKDLLMRQATRLRQGFYSWVRFCSVLERQEQSDNGFVAHGRVEKMNDYLLCLIERGHGIRRMLQALHAWARVCRVNKEQVTSANGLTRVLFRFLKARASRRWKIWCDATHYGAKYRLGASMLMATMKSVASSHLVRKSWSKWDSAVSSSRDDGEHSVQFTLRLLEMEPRQFIDETQQSLREEIATRLNIAPSRVVFHAFLAGSLVVQIRIAGVVERSHATELANNIRNAPQPTSVDSGTLVDATTFGSAVVSHVCVQTARDRALLRAWTVCLGMCLTHQRNRWVTNFFSHWKDLTRHDGFRKNGAAERFYNLLEERTGGAMRYRFCAWKSRLLRDEMIRQCLVKYLTQRYRARLAGSWIAWQMVVLKRRLLSGVTLLVESASKSEKAWEHMLRGKLRRWQQVVIGFRLRDIGISFLNVIGRTCIRMQLKASIYRWKTSKAYAFSKHVEIQRRYVSFHSAVGRLRRAYLRRAGWRAWMCWDTEVLQRVQSQQHAILACSRGIPTRVQREALRRWISSVLYKVNAERDSAALNTGLRALLKHHYVVKMKVFNIWRREDQDAQDISEQRTSRVYACCIFLRRELKRTGFRLWVQKFRSVDDSASAGRLLRRLWRRNQEVCARRAWNLWYEFSEEVAELDQKKAALSRKVFARITRAGLYSAFATWKASTKDAHTSFLAKQIRRLETMLYLRKCRRSFLRLLKFNEWRHSLFQRRRVSCMRIYFRRQAAEIMTRRMSLLQCLRSWNASVEKIAAVEASRKEGLRTILRRIYACTVDLWRKEVKRITSMRQGCRSLQYTSRRLRRLELRRALTNWKSRAAKFYFVESNLKRRIIQVLVNFADGIYREAFRKWRIGVIYLRSVAMGHGILTKCARRFGRRARRRLFDFWVAVAVSGTVGPALKSGQSGELPNHSLRTLVAVNRGITILDHRARKFVLTDGLRRWSTMVASVHSLVQAARRIKNIVGRLMLRIVSRTWTRWRFDDLRCVSANVVLRAKRLAAARVVSCMARSSIKNGFWTWQKQNVRSKQLGRVVLLAKRRRCAQAFLLLRRYHIYAKRCVYFAYVLARVCHRFAKLRMARALVVWNRKASKEMKTIDDFAVVLARVCRAWDGQLLRSAIRRWSVEWQLSTMKLRAEQRSELMLRRAHSHLVRGVLRGALREWLLANSNKLRCRRAAIMLRRILQLRLRFRTAKAVQTWCRVTFARRLVQSTQSLQQLHMSSMAEFQARSSSHLDREKLSAKRHALQCAGASAAQRDKYFRLLRTSLAVRRWLAEVSQRSRLVALRSQALRSINIVTEIKVTEMLKTTLHRWRANGYAMTADGPTAAMLARARNGRCKSFIGHLAALLRRKVTASMRRLLRHWNEVLLFSTRKSFQRALLRGTIPSAIQGSNLRGAWVKWLRRRRRLKTVLSFWGQYQMHIRNQRKLSNVFHSCRRAMFRWKIVAKHVVTRERVLLRWIDIRSVATLRQQLLWAYRQWRSRADFLLYQSVSHAAGVRLLTDVIHKRLRHRWWNAWKFEATVRLRIHLRWRGAVTLLDSIVANRWRKRLGRTWLAWLNRTVVRSRVLHAGTATLYAALLYLIKARIRRCLWRWRGENLRHSVVCLALDRLATIQSWCTMHAARSALERAWHKWRKSSVISGAISMAKYTACMQLGLLIQSRNRKRLAISWSRWAGNTGSHRTRRQFRAGAIRMAFHQAAVRSAIHYYSRAWRRWLESERATADRAVAVRCLGRLRLRRQTACINRAMVHWSTYARVQCMLAQRQHAFVSLCRRTLNKLRKDATARAWQCWLRFGAAVKNSILLQQMGVQKISRFMTLWERHRKLGAWRSWRNADIVLHRTIHQCRFLALKLYHSWCRMCQLRIFFAWDRWVACNQAKLTLERERQVFSSTTYRRKLQDAFYRLFAHCAQRASADRKHMALAHAARSVAIKRVKHAFVSWKQRIWIAFLRDMSSRLLIQMLRSRVYLMRHVSFSRWRAWSVLHRQDEQARYRHCMKMMGKWRRGTIGVSFDVWRNWIHEMDRDIKRLHSGDTLVTRITLRMSRKAYLRGWNTWIAFKNKCEEELLVKKRAVVRMLKSSLVSGFETWKDGCRAKSQASGRERQMKRIGSMLLRRGSAQAFRSWIAFVRDDRNSDVGRRLLAMTLGRVSSRRMAKSTVQAWALWNDFVASSQRDVERLLCAARQLIGTKVYSAFSAWRLHTDRSANFQDTATEVLKRMLRGAGMRCQGAFNTWRRACLHLRVEENLLSAMVARTTNASIRRALDLWKSWVAFFTRAEVACRRMLRSMSLQLGTAKRSIFYRWRSVAQHLKHREDTMFRYCRKVATTLLRGSIGGAFEIWKEAAAASYAIGRARCIMVRIMHRAGQGAKSAMCARALDTWVSNIAYMKVGDALMLRVLGRFLRNGISGAFLVWLKASKAIQESELNHSHLKQIMRRVIARCLRNGIFGAFWLWLNASKTLHDLELSQLHLKKIMRRVFARLLRNGISGAFLVWLSYCKTVGDLALSQSHLRQIMERVIRRLVIQPITTAWSTWKLVTITLRLNKHAAAVQRSNWVKQMMIRRVRRRTSNGFNWWKLRVRCRIRKLRSSHKLQNVFGHGVVVRAMRRWRRAAYTKTLTLLKGSGERTLRTEKRANAAIFLLRSIARCRAIIKARALSFWVMGLAQVQAAEILSTHKQSCAAQLDTAASEQVMQTRISAAARLGRRFLTARPAAIALRRWREAVRMLLLRARRISGPLHRWSRRCFGQSFFVWQAWAREKHLSQTLMSTRRSRAAHQMCSVLRDYLSFKACGNCFRLWALSTGHSKHQSRYKTIAVRALNSCVRAHHYRKLQVAMQWWAEQADREGEVAKMLGVRHAAMGASRGSALNKLNLFVVQAMARQVRGAWSRWVLESFNRAKQALRVVLNRHGTRRVAWAVGSFWSRHSNYNAHAGQRRAFHKWRWHILAVFRGRAEVTIIAMRKRLATHFMHGSIRTWYLSRIQAAWSIIIGSGRAQRRLEELERFRAAQEAREDALHARATYHQVRSEKISQSTGLFTAAARSRHRALGQAWLRWARFQHFHERAKLVEGAAKAAAHGEAFRRKEISRETLKLTRAYRDLKAKLIKAPALGAGVQHLSNIYVNWISKQMLRRLARWRLVCAEARITSHCITQLRDVSKHATEQLEDAARQHAEVERGTAFISFLKHIREAFQTRLLKKVFVKFTLWKDWVLYMKGALTHMVKLNVVGILWKRRFLATVRRFHKWRSNVMVAITLEHPNDTATRSRTRPLSPALSLSRSGNFSTLNLDLDSLAMTGIDLDMASTTRIATPTAATAKQRKNIGDSLTPGSPLQSLASPGLVSPVFNERMPPRLPHRPNASTDGRPVVHHTNSVSGSRRTPRAKRNGESRP